MKCHPFDPFSFTAGVALVAIGVALAVAGADVVDDARWVWPLALIAIGASGLASALRRDES